MTQGLVLAGIPGTAEEHARRRHPTMHEGEERPARRNAAVMHRVSPDPFAVLATDDRVRMSPRRGIVELLERPGEG